jgi:hypothetical protein
MMKRTIAAIAITLGLVACGSGDDDTGTPVDPGDEEPGDEEPADEEPADEEPGDEEPENEEPADDDAADDDAAASGSIDALDDIPKPCRDLMADFLRDVEPIVSQVDWQAATLSDFEQVSSEFEERANEFDLATEREGCDDLQFEEDDGFGLILELADDVAPGTVPFFEFLDSMRAGVPPIDGDDDGGTASGALEDCDDAIENIERLMAEYDAFTEVPVSELAKFANMASVMMSCTPDQLSFLENPEVSDFLSR